MARGKRPVAERKGGGAMTGTRGKICSKCGSTQDVTLYTVDGVTDGKGNAVGVPFCIKCAFETAGDPGEDREVGT